MEGSQETSSVPTSQDASGQAEHQQEKSRLQKTKDKLLPGVKISLLISLIFYLSSLVIGIWGIHKCPVNDNIPFFLIITGAAGMLSKTITVIRELLMKHYNIQYVESSSYTIESVFLLLGTYWVFKVYKPSFDPRDGLRYCNKTVYMFAFTYLVVLYSVIFLMVFCFCCFLGCIYFVKSTENRNQDPESPTRPIRESTSDEP